MNDDDAPEPYLERLIDETIGPLAHLFDAEELDVIRRTLRDDVHDDPDLTKLYQAARPRTPPLRSEEQPTDPRAAAGDRAAATPAEPRRRKGGAA